VPTVLVVLLAVAAAAGMFGLAWWSSGRSKKRFRGSSDHEIAKGLGTTQGMTHNPPGGDRGF
jgi:hypothetical protein